MEVVFVNNIHEGKQQLIHPPIFNKARSVHTHFAHSRELGTSPQDQEGQEPALPQPSQWQTACKLPKNRLPPTQS